jgi:hypothetical protein
VTVPNQCHVNGDGLFYITKFQTQLSVTKTSANPNDANANFEFITPEASHGHTGRTLKYFKTQVMGTLAQDLKDNPILQAIADLTQDLELPRAPGVVAIFLKGLFEKATALLDKKFPGKRTAHLHVVITHPCVWNDEELGQLKLAVEQVGIQGQVCQDCGVTYCPEQEASLMSTIVNNRTKLQPLYQVCLHRHLPNTKISTDAKTSPLDRRGDHGSGHGRADRGTYFRSRATSTDADCDIGSGHLQIQFP